MTDSSTRTGNSDEVLDPVSTESSVTAAEDTAAGGSLPTAAPGTPRPAVRIPRGLVRNLGWLATAVAVVIAIVVITAPGLIAHVDPVATSDATLKGPSGAHWFGTDQLGRDLFSRVIHGARPVLLSSLTGVALAIVAGVALGVAGGVAPKLLSAVIMRVIDVLLALPVLLLALIIMAAVGTGQLAIVIAIAVAFTPGFARVVNTSVRKLRSADYVQASRVFGATGLRTSVRHLLPNLATEVVILATSGIGWAVLTSTTLSFLGMGVHLPAPDWGSDLAAGATYLSTAWWLTTFPGAAITVTILTANFIGDQMASVLDPRSGIRIKRNLPAFLIGGSAARRVREERS
jgi:peptide/nickel transport system permease protein